MNTDAVTNQEFQAKLIAQLHINAAAAHVCTVEPDIRPAHAQLVKDFLASPNPAGQAFILRGFICLRIATAVFCNAVERFSHPSFSFENGQPPSIHTPYWEGVHPVPELSSVAKVIQAPKMQDHLARFGIAVCASDNGTIQVYFAERDGDWEPPYYEHLALQMECAFWRAKAHGQPGVLAVQHLLDRWAHELTDELPYDCRNFV